ncbi:MAG TPA: alpha-glucan family phosphorylase [Chthoniobacteraceae bacterium]|nr:alpha-glucan family phosphorylase [Chthoniobacteraceae bacterium]
MQPIHTFNVVPRLPDTLEPLRAMVFNLWWTWEPKARALFRHLDPQLWDRTNHNPLRMLQLSKQARLHEVAEDDDFLREMAAVYAKFEAYLARQDTYGKTHKESPLAAGPVAYFSAEFGFHESVPNYSGGLGILSGDHCKSASDLDINFVAVTLLYKQGYFRQQVNKEGLQESIGLNQNFSHLPLKDALDDKGAPLFVSVQMRGRAVKVKVWSLAIGRITLYMLDTDVPENSEEDRLITAQLYGGDHELRVKQEIVLGIGGVHALHALGIKPSVYHMNEGHSAFLSLELIRRQVADHKLDFYSALQIVAAANIFTTHTPVPAGNDAFALDLMHKYFGDYPGQVGIDWPTFASFGQFRHHPTEPFSMTILALRTSRHANGVSKLHGRVSQGLWKDVWAGVPQNEVPITSITNGIHTRTWMAPAFAELYDRYLPGWEEHLADGGDKDFWRGVVDIPDEEIWSTHQRLKARLIAFVHDRVRRQRIRLGESPESIRNVSRLLDPEVLTIGFARRFATYKRATLLFADPERLQKLLKNTERPVQFVFAGKAHPKDEPGKQFIQKVYQFTRMPEFENRIVFVEDYDHYVGRRMYQGVDLWLNNPRRPLEASGTSGMKLPPSGGLNLSVLDGWWCEAYRQNKKSGWAIGAEIPESAATINPTFEDEVDVASLFHILETQIVPLYYAKPDGRLPVAWIQLMRESIRTVVPTFNTHRMVKEYTEKLYQPAAKAHEILAAKGGEKAIELSRWKDSIRKHWPQIQIKEVHVKTKPAGVFVRDAVHVEATVHLGPVDPALVTVQAYFGEAVDNAIENPETQNLTRLKKLDDSDHLYTGTIKPHESGSYGLNVRVIPTHPNLIQSHELRLITWAK